MKQTKESNWSYAGAERTVIRSVNFCHRHIGRSIFLSTLMGVLGPGFETVEGSWVLKVQQPQARSTGFKVSSTEFYFIMHKPFYFWKVTTLESLFISYSCTLWDTIIFHGDPTTLTISLPQNLEGHGPNPPGLTPMTVITKNEIEEKKKTKKYLN